VPAPPHLLVPVVLGARLARPRGEATASQDRPRHHRPPSPCSTGRASPTSRLFRRR
jgi:hypothetical protein